MTRQIVTCRTGDGLQMALDAMAEHQFRRIPIVDDDNKGGLVFTMGVVDDQPLL